MACRLPRLMVAAPSSASGKTTVACALLRALVLRGLQVASFKCGPDYIDPMFHRESVGVRSSSNLDLFFGDEALARRLLVKRSFADIAVIEGAMGLYDGIAVTSEASSYALARATGTPVALVVGCKGMAASIAAQVKGMQAYRPDANIRAVVLNRLPPSLYPEVKALIERECGVPVAGYLPAMADCALESRHLGLVTAAEVEGLREKLDLLAAQAQRTLDLELLMKLAGEAPDLEEAPRALPKVDGCPQIAVAKDKAFCFYYADTLDLLRELGARLVEFSPLGDERLPDGTDGLLLGGGYPELCAERLSRNKMMLKSVRQAVRGGMPAIAECGGFMYLGEGIQDENGRIWQMAGVLSGQSGRAERLRRFGYCTLTAKEDNMLCAAGDTLPAHEFHRWDSDDCGDGFAAKKPLRETAWDCVHAGPRLFAGYPHLYLAARPRAAARFLGVALDYQRERERREREQ